MCLSDTFLEVPFVAQRECEDILPPLSVERETDAFPRAWEAWVQRSTMGEHLGGHSKWPSLVTGGWEAGDKRDRTHRNVCAVSCGKNASRETTQTG